MNHKAVMNDMKYSLKQVERAKPIIKDLLNGGEIKAVEGEENEICKMLDLTCGTDYFQIYSKNDKNLDGLVWGVASRFQKVRHGFKPYNTFTIRRSRESGAATEYAKRKFAIKHGGTYPFLTMQGYYDSQTEEILSLAIAKTTDIFDAIENGLYSIRETGYEQIGQATFFVVDWDVFKKNGYNLKLYQCNAAESHED